MCGGDQSADRLDEFNDLPGQFYLCFPVWFFIMVISKPNALGHGSLLYMVPEFPSVQRSIYARREYAWSSYYDAQFGYGDCYGMLFHPISPFI